MCYIIFKCVILLDEDISDYWQTSTANFTKTEWFSDFPKFHCYQWNITSFLLQNNFRKKVFKKSVHNLFLLLMSLSFSLSLTLSLSLSHFLLIIPPFFILSIHHIEKQISVWCIASSLLSLPSRSFFLSFFCGMFLFSLWHEVIFSSISFSSIKMEWSVIYQLITGRNIRIHAFMPCSVNIIDYRWILIHWFLSTNSPNNKAGKFHKKVSKPMT